MDTVNARDAMIELITTHKVMEAPVETRRAGGWVECVIGIDDNNVAYLTMPVESYDILRKQHVFEKRLNEDG